MGHEYVNGSSGAVTNYKKLEEVIPTKLIPVFN